MTNQDFVPLQDFPDYLCRRKTPSFSYGDIRGGCFEQVRCPRKAQNFVNNLAKL